jgi:hypothetical protein
VVTSVVARCGPKSSSIPNPVVDTPPLAAFSKGIILPSLPILLFTMIILSPFGLMTILGKLHWIFAKKNLLCCHYFMHFLFVSIFQKFVTNYFRLLLITPAVTLPDFEKYLNSLIPRFKPGGVVEDAAIYAAAVRIMLKFPPCLLCLRSGVLMRSSSNQSRFTAEVLIDDPDFEFFLRLAKKALPLI